MEEQYRKTYRDAVYDEERALYGLNHAQIVNCRFEGAQDGESPLKECKRIRVDNCDFQLRYPLWHAHHATLTNCRMTQSCRAALWYDEQLALRDCTLDGIKAMRECSGVSILGGLARSSEFGWKCRDISIRDFALESEYPFLMTREMEVDQLRMKAKYAFQYVRNVTIRHSTLDTKDAFWHSENVTVSDSVIKGEYLGWYSRNLHLIRCRIIGTQPLCYCEGLVLQDCVMEDTDLSFENSDVKATVRGEIMSVKNPRHGSIEAETIGVLIKDSHCLPDADCTITAHVIRHRTK